MFGRIILIYGKPSFFNGLTRFFNIFYISLTHFSTVQKLQGCLPLCTGKSLNVGASICRNRTNALWNGPFHNLKTNEDNKYVHYGIDWSTNMFCGTQLIAFFLSELPAKTWIILKVLRYQSAWRTEVLFHEEIAKCSSHIRTNMITLNF